MNDTQNITSCFHTDQYLIAQEIVFNFTYFAMVPIYFSFGLSIHLICVIVLYRNLKKESAYGYQFYLIAVETIEIILMILYCLAFNWCGSKPFPRCAGNFIIVWYATHLSYQLLNGFTTCRLLITVSMSIDRIISISNPIKYKNMNRKFRQKIALFLCLVIGLCANISSVFGSEVAWDSTNEIYIYVPNEDYINTTTSKILTIIWDITLFGGFLILIVSNAVLIRVYRTRLNSVGKMISTSDSKQKQKQAKEKMITVLGVSQSIISFIDIGFNIAYYSAYYFVPKFFDCWGGMVFQVFDLSFMITGTVGLYVVLYAVKSFRKLIKDELKCVLCS